MLNSYITIKTYLPVDLSVVSQRPISEKLIVDTNKHLSNIVQFLRESDPVGRVGNYSAVFEIGFGVEGFIPLKFSNPTQGQGNDLEETPSISFTTYASSTLSKGIIHTFVDRLADIHPWEHPVIEIASIELWMPNIKSQV